MDSIDITDSAFTLDVPEVNYILSSTSDKSFQISSMIYIYIGIAAFALLAILYFYKKNTNEKKNISNQYSQDCPGGFCTMNS